MSSRNSWNGDVHVKEAVNPEYATLLHDVPVELSAEKSFADIISASVPGFEAAVMQARLLRLKVAKKIPEYMKMFDIDDIKMNAVTNDEILKLRRPKVLDDPPNTQIIPSSFTSSPSPSFESFSSESTGKSAEKSVSRKFEKYKSPPPSKLRALLGGKKARASLRKFQEPDVREARELLLDRKDVHPESPQVSRMKNIEELMQTQKMISVESAGRSRIRLGRTSRRLPVDADYIPSTTKPKRNLSLEPEADRIKTRRLNSSGDKKGMAARISPELRGYGNTVKVSVENTWKTRLNKKNAVANFDRNGVSVESSPEKKDATNGHSVEKNRDGSTLSSDELQSSAHQAAANSDKPITRRSTGLVAKKNVIDANLSINTEGSAAQMPSYTAAGEVAPFKSVRSVHSAQDIKKLNEVSVREKQPREGAPRRSPRICRVSDPLAELATRSRVKKPRRMARIEAEESVAEERICLEKDVASSEGSKSDVPVSVINNDASGSSVGLKSEKSSRKGCSSENSSVSLEYPLPAQRSLSASIVNRLLQIDGHSLGTSTANELQPREDRPHVPSGENVVPEIVMDPVVSQNHVCGADLLLESAENDGRPMENETPIGNLVQRSSQTDPILAIEINPLVNRSHEDLTASSCFAEKESLAEMLVALQELTDKSARLEVQLAKKTENLLGEPSKPPIPETEGDFRTGNDMAQCDMDVTFPSLNNTSGLPEHGLGARSQNVEKVPNEQIPEKTASGSDIEATSETITPPVADPSESSCNVTGFRNEFQATFPNEKPLPLNSAGLIKWSNGCMSVIAVDDVPQSDHDLVGMLVLPSGERRVLAMSRFLRLPEQSVSSTYCFTITEQVDIDPPNHIHTATSDDTSRMLTEVVTSPVVTRLGSPTPVYAPEVVTSPAIRGLGSPTPVEKTNVVEDPVTPVSAKQKRPRGRPSVRPIMTPDGSSALVGPGRDMFPDISMSRTSPDGSPPPRKRGRPKKTISPVKTAEPLPVVPNEPLFCKRCDIAVPEKQMEHFYEIHNGLMLDEQLKFTLTEKKERWKAVLKKGHQLSCQDCQKICITVTALGIHDGTCDKRPCRTCLKRVKLDQMEAHMAKHIPKVGSPVRRGHPFGLPLQ